MNSSRFQKGHIPWNKATKGLVKPNRGSFLRGQIPWNKGMDLPIKPLSAGKDLAYILGVSKGDGSIYYSFHNKYRIDLSVKDTLFADSFARSLENIGLKPWIGKKRQNYRGEVRYYPRVIANSKALYQLFNNGWQEIVQQNKSTMIAFIRGFYESEGSIRPNNANKNWRISIDNKDESLLIFTQSLLDALGFQFHLGSYKKQNGQVYYYLHNGKTQELLNFIELINPCIKSIL